MSVVSELTKDCPRWHRLPVEPKGNLGQDYSHEARHVGLDDKVANLPLQVKVSHHHGVLTCGKQQSRKGGVIWHGENTTYRNAEGEGMRHTIDGG